LNVRLTTFWVATGLTAFVFLSGVVGDLHRPAPSWPA
jgi:hypothetical protein